MSIVSEFYYQYKWFIVHYIGKNCSNLGKKEANDGAEYYYLVSTYRYLASRKLLAVLNPFRFLFSSSPFTRASFFFYNILI